MINNKLCPVKLCWFLRLRSRCMRGRTCKGAKIAAGVMTGARSILTSLLQSGPRLLLWVIPHAVPPLHLYSELLKRIVFF